MTMLVQSAGAAARAYQIGQSTPAAKMPESPLSGPSFLDMVENAARSTVQTVHRGDNAVAAGLKGEMDTQQVVEAVMEMESALRVSVALRDKMVEATQEILRMSV